MTSKSKPLPSSTPQAPAAGAAPARRGRKPRAPEEKNLLKEHEMRRGRHHGQEGEALAEEELEDRQFVVALARGLQVLTSFRAKDGPLSNRDFAERTGIPTATVSRLSHTLTKLGYLKFDPRRETYDLAGSTLALSYVALARLDIRNVARPLMRELADYANANVGLGIADRKMMMYIETAEGSGLIGLRLFAGSRIPMATSAMGRAYLAAQPEERREALLEELRPQFGADWDTVRRGIARAVREVAQYGFCTSIAEWQKDIHGVAAPLVLPEGHGTYVLNLGGPAYLLKEKQLLEDLGPRLRGVAREILSMSSPGGARP